MRTSEALNNGSDPDIVTWNITFDWSAAGEKRNGAHVYLNGSYLGFIEEADGIYHLWRPVADVWFKQTPKIGAAVAMLIDEKISKMERDAP